MSFDILFETSRFNLSEVKEHFINPCCFGEDLAAWLQARLIERGVVVDGSGQEDWGWYLGASYERMPYFIGIGGNPDEESEDPNYGEWRVMVVKVRSTWEKLRGKNVMTQDDIVYSLIREIIRNEHDFVAVRTEPSLMGRLKEIK